MVEEKFGIKATSEMVSFIISLVQACIKSAEDKQFTMADSVYFWAAIQSLPAVIKSAGQIPSEMVDLSVAEIAQLAALVLAITVVFEGLKIGPLVLALKK